jgi:hypothetical protein
MTLFGIEKFCIRNGDKWNHCVEVDDMFALLLRLLFLAGAVYLLYRLTSKFWSKAEVKDVEQEAKQYSDLASKVEKIDVKKAKRDKKKVEDFKRSL